MSQLTEGPGVNNSMNKNGKLENGKLDCGNCNNPSKYND